MTTKSDAKRPNARAPGPTAPEDRLLALLARLGESDRSVERGAQLPTGWLSRARAGGKREAAGSWARLRGYLTVKLGPEALDATTPPAPGEATDVGADDSGAACLAGALQRADTPEDLVGALRAVARAALRGEIDRPTGRLMLDVAREVRQALRLKMLETPKGDPFAESIVIVDPEEWALIAARRKSLEVPPLRPGETPAPPKEAAP